jgi:hypothetical protein
LVFVLGQNEIERIGGRWLRGMSWVVHIDGCHVRTHVGHGL